MYPRGYIIPWGVQIYTVRIAIVRRALTGGECLAADVLGYARIIPSIELCGHDVIGELPITTELSPATQINGVKGTLIALLHNYGDTSLVYMQLVTLMQLSC
ncbi:hypothetical protein E4T56_gene6037 [Termitomyces sp. T112]|nr:hypothetical protein E4T56_gene6037 [Termitomyces sp. T112]